MCVCVCVLLVPMKWVIQEHLKEIKKFMMFLFILKTYAFSRILLILYTIFIFEWTSSGKL